MRKSLLGGLAAATMVASSLAMVAGPALADPSSDPGANDIVGVGSDTSQFALNYLADGHNGTQGYNQANPSANKLVSFDAISPVTPDPNNGTIVLRSGHAAVTRPNGSGQGLATLYGAGNNPDVSYARSSSAIDSTMASAGLYMLPFALDTLKTAVAPTSNAPATLTRAQLLGIYKGTITNWSDVGGQPGVIKAYIPQSGSGTLKFFTAQLTAENGGAAFTYGQNIATTQEHSDTDIKNDPNAIAPFSAGRAALLGTLRIEGGFFANRALYNVVRQTGTFSVSTTDIQNIFGSNGFVCSTAAAPLITAAGFTQLATPAHGGKCGEATQTATSNFATSGTATTHTALSVSQPTGTDVKLLASVSGGQDPAGHGSLHFFEGSTDLGAGTLANGQYSLTLPSVATGAHTYKATYTATDNSVYTDSNDTQTFTVRNATTSSVSVTPASPYYGQARSAVVTVASGSGTPTGNVTVSVGSWSATKALTNGTATVVLPTTTAVGARSVGVSYAGDSTSNSSSATKAFTVRKAGVKITESFASTIAKHKRAKGTVKVVLSPSSSLRPTGHFTITRGSKKLYSGTLSGGARTLTLPALPKGKNTLVVRYAGSSTTNAKTLTFTIVQK